MLLDSNTVIYSAQHEYTNLRHFLAQHRFSVSAITYLEVLGYPELIPEEQDKFEKLFSTMQVLPISDEVIKKAVQLRRQRKLKGERRIADFIIAATALVHGLTLVTHNVKDFEWIEELSILDPLKMKES
ncbi:nucleic acid-binding protein, containing PIN domain [Beggiatoa sp. PS]|nr:nucleic acid-binding protein, containing PIN domain [Beggiatoa sp. PS]